MADSTDQPAKFEHPATDERIAVRVDGDWMTHAAEYGGIVVFWRDDEWDHLDEGQQIDVTPDNVCWVPEKSTPNPLEEYLDEGGVTSYIAPNEYDISNVEVHDVTESEAHRSFYPDTEQSDPAEF
jgi:hypothetical protein